MKEVGTVRIEAFSDGVFAIAATLLVLQVGVGSPAGAQLGHELVAIWPSYLAYVTSFVTIGIIWINHQPIRSRHPHPGARSLLPSVGHALRRH